MAEERKYYVWFNSASIEESDREWMKNIPDESYTINGLRRESERHTITHVILWFSIPPDIHNLFPHLTHLLLKGIGSSARRSRISELKTLKKLNVSRHLLSDDIPDDMFESLQSLRELNIIGCSLRTLPKSISQLRNLEILNMPRNNLSNNLPDDMFTSLQSLKELNISGCILTTPPKSMSRLRNLQILNMSWNRLSGNLLADMLTSLQSLKELNISDCHLTTLPKSIQNLQDLQRLDISDNVFTNIPHFVYTLSSLQELDISDNKLLKSLDPEILQLTQLHTLNTDDCDALTTPPQEVCRGGLNAVRQYYKDLAQGSGKNIPFATVAVLGNTMAGKTSLVRTLQNRDRKRILTDRSPEAAVDETTKVFNVQEVEVDGTMLRVLDMGGQEVYHAAYQLTLRQNCIPVVVINMEEYDSLSTKFSSREAVRRLAFDYMSHLYLANPALGAPKLILTHRDKFTSTKFLEQKSSFLNLVNQISAEFVKEEKEVAGEFCQIQHFKESAGGIFIDDDIYEVGIDDEYEVFDQIKKSLFQSSQAFVKPLPLVWEETNDGVLFLESAYNSFWFVLAMLRLQNLQLESGQLDIILTYMHDCGKILWYKDLDTLKPYIFHKTSEVTKLLTVLYHHDPSVWDSRHQFLPFLSGHKNFEIQDFEASVSHFIETGVLTNNLLNHLIKTQTEFRNHNDVEVAICLLKTFRLLHGPLHHQSGDDSTESCFIAPQFAREYLNIEYQSPKRVCLHVGILFNGLALPHYVYHQMTVGLLERFPDEVADIKVKRNGVDVYQDEIYTRLIHDYKSRKVLLFVSSDAENICKMWQILISSTNSILRHVSETWPACRPVPTVHCGHCLLLGNPHPIKKTSPQWCLRSVNSAVPRVKSYKGSSTIKCQGEVIPAALLYPCETLSETDSVKFKSAVSELIARREENQPDTSVEDNHQSDLRTEEVTANDDLSDLSDEDEYSYPDKEKGVQMRLIRPKLETTTNSKIKQLFSNTEKVYSMTRKRGRALIISNKNFDKRPDLCRVGSDVDVENMSVMLKDFKFEVVTHTDLKTEAILSTIKHEVQRKEHEDLGCHVLVIMTHGDVNNFIYGVDMKKVSLTHVYDLLTPLNFPRMSGKPKIVILETCSGTRIDVGNRGIDSAPNVGQAQIGQAEIVSPSPTRTQTVENTKSKSKESSGGLLAAESCTQSGIDADDRDIGQEPGVGPAQIKDTGIVSPSPAEKQKIENLESKKKESSDELLIAEPITESGKDIDDKSIDPVPDAQLAQKEDGKTGSPLPVRIPGDKDAEAMTRLNYDDLLVVKASMESFISKIHPVYGSLMVRALVSSMYRHAGHHDLYTIFKQVQTKVRKLCLEKRLDSGQLVVAWDTFTHMRKLYLFPGFNGYKRDDNS